MSSPAQAAPDSNKVYDMIIKSADNAEHRIHDTESSFRGLPLYKQNYYDEKNSNTSNTAAASIPRPT